MQELWMLSGMQELERARAELEAALEALIPLRERVSLLEKEAYQRLLLDMEKADPEDMEAAWKHWDTFLGLPSLHFKRDWAYASKPLSVTPEGSPRYKEYIMDDALEALSSWGHPNRDMVATIHNVIRDRVVSFVHNW